MNKDFSSSFLPLHPASLCSQSTSQEIKLLIQPKSFIVTISIPHNNSAKRFKSSSDFLAQSDKSSQTKLIHNKKVPRDVQLSSSFLDHSSFTSPRSSFSTSPSQINKQRSFLFNQPPAPASSTHIKCPTFHFPSSKSPIFLSNVFDRTCPDCDQVHPSANMLVSIFHNSHRRRITSTSYCDYFGTESNSHLNMSLPQPHPRPCLLNFQPSSNTRPFIHTTTVPNPSIFHHWEWLRSQAMLIYLSFFPKLHLYQAIHRGQSNSFSTSTPLGHRPIPGANLVNKLDSHTNIQIHFVFFTLLQINIDSSGKMHQKKTRPFNKKFSSFPRFSIIGFAPV